MTPGIPPNHNRVFVAPEGMSAEQVSAMSAFQGTLSQPQSNLDGADFIVVAWKPSPEEVKAIQEGGMVYLSCLQILPPHFITTSFSEATYGQQE
jgi:hypothetical protein